MGSNRLARYANTTAEICFPRYIDIHNAREYFFVLNGDMDKLQKICDDWYNGVEGGKLNIQPINSRVVMRLVDCNCASGFNCSLDDNEVTKCNPSECRVGTIRDTEMQPIGRTMFNQLEFSFFVKNPEGKLFLCSPFRYTDNGILMVNERELIGFPTSHCEFGNYNRKSGCGFTFEQKRPIEFFRSDQKNLDFNTMMNFEFPDGNIVQNEYASGGMWTRPEVLLELSKSSNSAIVFRELDTEQTRTQLESMLTRDNRREMSGFSASSMVRLLLEKRHYLSMLQFRDIASTRYAMVQSVFEVAGYKEEVHRGGATNEVFSLDFNRWKDDSMNTDVQNQTRRDLGLTTAESIVERVVNNFRIDDALGIEEVDNIPCCYADVSFTLIVQKILWKYAS